MKINIIFKVRVKGIQMRMFKIWSVNLTSKEIASTLALGRRKILAKIFSSAVAIDASQSIVLPAFALKNEENPLLSLESAAAQLRDGGSDPLSHRLN